MSKNSKDQKSKPKDETVAINRRGRFDYEIEDSVEAGLVLTGTEVKSIRQGKAQIAESYATIEKSGRERAEVWLVGMHVPPYEQGNVFNVEPRRKRKLLLRRDQIERLQSRIQQKGYTLVPLKLYFTRGRAKLELGIGKGRKSHDKREAITERQIKRDLRNEL
ncbi:MAG TPA: SsrA-binding protein SmpB [Abditibacteriaceae bacterium]|jgi:SsrA-binding protein